METQATETQMEKQVPNWTFEGKEYPCFVADNTYSIGVQIKRNPEDKEPIGIIVSNFDWSKHEEKGETIYSSTPFVNRLDLDWKAVRDVKENVTEQQRKNLDRQNATCFDAIITDGEMIANKDGEHQPPIALSRAQMQSRTTELKSNIISQFLSGFHIKRHFPKGVDELDALTSGSVEAIHFLCSIGDAKNPTNLLLLSFGVPNDDQRRAFDDNKVKNESQVEQGVETVWTTINSEMKLRYAKKHLQSVKGAAVNLDGQLTEVSNDITLTQFKDSFCPDWFFRLGDALQDTFDIGGKSRTS